ncbi:MAG: hypothetical protein Ct9H300mP1_01830 [Planctomycetaceae bacterium]|nr:MAG: hypothetical protein Ct9H300mP1_01830 [Planctomycetaceae bacterium]
MSTRGFRGKHGPHLPLATDTLQSYAVLERLAAERDGVVIAPPVDYGQLTWGLPFGMSIDITAALLTRYVPGVFANAIVDWLQPAAAYVVDVHGSIVHRTAIQDGLAASNIDHWSFPLVARPVGGSFGRPRRPARRWRGDGIDRMDQPGAD